MFFVFKMSHNSPRSICNLQKYLRGYDPYFFQGKMMEGRMVGGKEERNALGRATEEARKRRLMEERWEE